MYGRKTIGKGIALLLAAALLLSCVSAASAADGEGVLNGLKLEKVELWNGFTAAYPVYSTPGSNERYSESNCWYTTTDETAPYRFECNTRSYYIDTVAEDPEVATAWYDSTVLGSGSAEITASETIEIDGHPARIVIFHVMSPEYDSSLGMLDYLRNNGLLRVRLFCIAQNGTTWEDLPKVTVEDMKTLASGISYDPSGATITKADGEMTVTAKGDVTVLTAGKKLQFSVAFAEPDKIKQLDKTLKADAVEWSVTDAETGAAAEDVTINAKGALSAGKKIAAPKKVEVKASSPFFHTSAVFTLTILPVVSKITTDPAEIVFFAGTDTTATVKAVLDPDTVPLQGITWQMKKEGIVEMTAGEDGTASFKPLAAGKTTVVVAEPGGKKFTLKVSVVEPVTQVEVTAKGKPVPGGTVTLKAVLTPKNAGVKDVKWTVVTGGDAATVNEKGQVKISKEAKPGTVISVSCEAAGAPEPVSTLTSITVE